MGKRCHQHVKDNFSSEAFRKQLSHILEEAMATQGEVNKDD